MREGLHCVGSHHTLLTGSRELSPSLAEVPVILPPPQGSILGPVLFNLAVRKLPECVASTKVRQFADDVSVHKSGRDQQKLTADLARDVLSIRL